MRRLVAVGAAMLGFILFTGSAAHAAAPPAEFGSDWDDPRTADQPIAKPPTPSCTVTIVDHKFRDFTPYTGTYTPAADCAGPWNKVVLRMETSIAGRQYDRLGSLNLGGVTIFKTSTAEPSADGVRWTVESDVTRYAPILTRQQPVWMLIGNVVDETYTGILDTKVELTFYQATADHPAAQTSDDVLPLADARQSGGELHGTITVARNTERLVAEVYATGSGGGCEEFWYGTTPPDTGYSCGTAAGGPYREVQVLIDDQVAGIAAPYPHIYTGGWSNPFLWYVLPAPRAFNIQATRYDLTPFAGQLTDGQPHRVRVRTVGVPAGQSGWDTPTNFLVWRDHDSTRVTGKLLSHGLGTLRTDLTSSVEGDTHRVTVEAAHRFRAVGYLDTSHGRVVTTVEQALTNHNEHYWGPEESPDGQHAAWTDTSTATTSGRGAVPRVSRTAKRFTLDGEITIVNDRLTTRMTLGDYADETTAGTGQAPWRRLANTFTGSASWTLGVPRSERHAVGESEQRYRVTGPHGTCYDHRIAQVNGTIAADELRCG
ncbi:peptide-N4-asparagine amidase [Micromonospora sp. SL1-18]|uniref:peptide-N4-asparagine amidase n=1 Tax=Micromonospora sp. SL1-18 TaxID=3399128 RepID=UPI003A4E1885